MIYLFEHFFASIITLFERVQKATLTLSLTQRQARASGMLWSKNDLPC